MKRPPYPARVAAGIVVTALEETRRLPTKIITLPMSAVSKTLQSGMRLQQNIAEMAIKGDEALSRYFEETEEQPEWAVFDEDESTADEVAEVALDAEPAPKPANAPAATKPAAKKPAPETAAPNTGAGRFALFSEPPADLVDGAGDSATETADDRPKAVIELHYDDLTLAQLRAKLRGLHAEQLIQLVDYERAHRNRQPFVTMIDNKLSSLQKK